ncbi:tyrosine-type recombinase/integrase [Leucobacter ruminantium]|uniref:Site-specific integrase n=1 Tax=Leucobacter ruminantium TaxID=1289170 RepID=A0A939LW47_9MICO|nr:site-specific integrase [Leucobacter ruminantium]MBO1805889.1 site-specific integrase [Leucobacter ruminantium]
MGSVHSYTTAKGEKRYRIAYRRPDNKQTNERGFKRKRDAELRLAEVEISKIRGEFVNHRDGNVTLDMLGSDWLNTKKAVVKPSSFLSFSTAWKVHVQPKWGARKVASIRHSEVQAWVSELTTAKSATVVLRAHGILASILDAAVRDQRIVKNVARGISLPKKKAKGKPYLTHAQVEQLAAVASKPTIVRFLAYTGLRWGEMAGLHVEHVDTKKRRVNIRQNAVTVGSKIEVGTPKTHEARTVPYPAFLDEEIAALIKGKGARNILFGDGEHYMPLPRTKSGWFSRAVERCIAADTERADKAVKRGEVPPPIVPRVTPHDLRHTAASLAISAGANVKAVQRMLGHASAAMTLDTYADLFDDDLDDVAAALDRARSNVVNPLSGADDEK